MPDIIPNVVVSMPSQLFTMPRKFAAVFGGRIYIGLIDTDPTIPSNQIQVYLENEDGSLVPMAQPILINAGGYPVYNGQVSKFVTVEGHSMAVYDSLNVQQFYFPNVLKYDPDQLQQRLSSAADGEGDALVAVKQPIENSIERTQHYKNAEVISIQDFGGVGDDSINNDTAITSAAAVGTRVLVPAGVYRTALSAAAVGPLHGEGVVRTSDGYKRGKIFTAVTVAPASLGNEDSVVTAFNGDSSKSPFQIEHRITGAATLGQPTTGYTYQPESMPNYTYLYNTSGWNQGLSGNVGRTGVAAYRAKIAQLGQGDVMCFNGSAFVTGTKLGSTNFLANPAAGLFAGDIGAGSNGVYMNPHEIILHDNGYDVAAVGFVGNFDRTVGTGAKSAIWHGIRLQSIGTMQCDAMFSASGKWRSGIDLAQSTTDLGANQAAISLKSGQRIYLNNNANASGNTEAGWHTTGYNGDYIAYIGDHISVVSGGNPSLEVSSVRVTFNAQIGIKSAGNVSSSATSGTNALPSNPAGFISIYIDGNKYKMPFYNA